MTHADATSAPSTDSTPAVAPLPIGPFPPGLAEWMNRPLAPVDCSVIIVNYNSRAMLERTLETLMAAGTQVSQEVIVVDNASRDDSMAMVRTRFPAVHCIVNTSNSGYTRANNQGMLVANGRYLMLLNNDTIIRPGAIDALVQYLDTHHEIGGAGSRVLNIDGTIQGTVKADPTPLAAIFGRHALLTRLFPRNPISRRYLIYLDQDFSQPFAAATLSSCALMVRREVVVTAGLIDDRYFVYWSDDDWCRAIRSVGYSLACVPASVIVHDEHKGGTRSQRKTSWRTITDFHRGAYHYYRKWHPRPTWHPVTLLAAAGLSARALLVWSAEQVRWSRWMKREAA